MTNPQEVQTVVLTYRPQRKLFWSKVAKRITGFHSHRNSSFTSNWTETFTKWFEEIRYIENTFTMMEILRGISDGKVRSIQDFITDLAAALEERGLLTADEGRNMRSERAITEKPDNPRAQAIIIKLFFELSLKRAVNEIHTRAIRMEDLIDGPLDRLLTLIEIRPTLGW